MLQQTQVATVIPYYHNFIEKFPDIHMLAAADLQDVLKAWEKMGYYARARNLHKAAKVVVNELNGEIPATYEAFRQLPGVGDYIAAAVQSIAFGHPFAVVDGNVKRVLARLLLLDTPVNQTSTKPVFTEKATELLAIDSPGDYNQAIMELGALICAPKNPACAECPVNKHCLAFQMNEQESFPKRIQKKKIPEYHLIAAVISNNNKFLIVQRSTEGMLGGLWEFPGGEISKGETAAKACVRNVQECTQLEITELKSLTKVKHAYTHFKITVEVFQSKLKSGKIKLNGPVDFRWISKEELSDYPFTGVVHKFLKLIINE